MKTKDALIVNNLSHYNIFYSLVCMYAKLTTQYTFSRLNQNIPNYYPQRSISPLGIILDRYPEISSISTVYIYYIIHLKISTCVSRTPLLIAGGCAAAILIHANNNSVSVQQGNSTGRGWRRYGGRI